MKDWRSSAVETFSSSSDVSICEQQEAKTLATLVSMIDNRASRGETQMQNLGTMEMKII